MNIEGAFADDRLIVTATDRLARELRLRYNADMRARGRRGWFAPSIQSFRLWTLNEWRALWPAEQLLYPAQELSLWLWALEAGDKASSIINRTAAARAARNLGGLLTRSGAIIADLQRPHAAEDEVAFVEWWSAVERKRQARGWITEDQLPWALIEHLREGRWSPNIPLLCVGFVETTAAQRALFDAMRESGCPVETVARIAPSKATLNLRRVPTTADQYRAVAAELRERLCASTGEPPRCAVLVGDLNQARPHIEAAFREILAPHTMLVGGAARKPWRYGRGQAALDRPMVGAVFDVLSIEGGGSDLATLSRVTLSPWLFPEASSAERAELDLWFRRSGGTRFVRSRAQRLAQAFLQKRPENRFAAHFYEWVGGLGSAPAEALPSEWAERWSACLSAAGWGAPPRCTEELQDVTRAWDEALDAFRAMDSQLRAVSHGRALTWLREILSEQPAQPSAEHYQPVQVLGFHDISGMVFDFVAVCDATATALPGPAFRSGFVSAEVLRRLGVVEASPEGMLAKANRWIEHLHGAASEIAVYAPSIDDKGAEVTPTPLIPGWAESPIVRCAGVMSTMDQIVAAGPSDVKPAADDAPAVQDPENEGVRGGTAILSDAAVSPFLALLRARLGLRPFPRAEDGLDAATQGTTLHRVMELVWGELKDSDRLRTLDLEQLGMIVREAVDQACEAEGHVSVARYGRGLASLEQSRLARLVRRWLGVERARAWDFRVVARELQAQASIAGLPLGLRIDRVDEIQLPDGNRRTVLIDYKTGSTALRASAWEPGSLVEPQLPAYATFADLAAHEIDRVDGIAFAQISDARMQFVLCANFADRLCFEPPKSAGEGVEDWSGRLSAWREALVLLAQGFMSGSTVIDRQRFSRSGRAMDLAPLARESAGETDDE